MRKNRFALAAVWLVLVLLQLYVNNIYSLMLLAAGLLLPVLSVLMSLRMQRRISAQLEVPGAVEYGAEEGAPIGLRIRNNASRETAVCGTVNLHNVLTGSSVSCDFQHTVSGRTSCVVGLLPEDLEAGRIDVEVSRFYRTDLFRLVQFRIPLPKRDHFTVLPPELPVTVQARPTAEIRSDSEQFSEQEPGQDPSEVFDIRGYVPGDPVRAIHWKQSARFGQPMVREFSRPQAYSAQVLPELSGTDPRALEAVVSYAWNLSAALLEAGVAHTLSWYSEAEDRLITRNLSGFPDLETAGQELLEAVRYDETDAALEQFLVSDAADPETALFYLTPSLDSPLLFAAAADLPTRVFWVTEERTLPEEAVGLTAELLPSRLDRATAIDIIL